MRKGKVSSKYCKEYGIVGIIVLIIVVLLTGAVGGWYFLGVKEKLTIQESLKPDTIPSTVSQTPDAPRTEIVEKGFNADMIITPSENNVIKETVTISMTKVPEGTNSVGFIIQGSELVDVTKTGPNLGTDSDGSDGWDKVFDTTTYENGVYEISIIVYPSPERGSDPIGAATARVEIKN